MFEIGTVNFLLSFFDIKTVEKRNLSSVGALFRMSYWLIHRIKYNKQKANTEKIFLRTRKKSKSCETTNVSWQWWQMSFWLCFTVVLGHLDSYNSCLTSLDACPLDKQSSSLLKTTKKIFFWSSWRILRKLWNRPRKLLVQENILLINVNSGDHVLPLSLQQLVRLLALVMFGDSPHCVRYVCCFRYLISFFCGRQSLAPLTFSPTSCHLLFIFSSPSPPQTAAS